MDSIYIISFLKPMILKTLRNICFSYADKLLIDHADLNINFRDKICLIGRNGVGKTTLMKIIAKQIEPDSGKIWTSSNIKVSYFMQNIPSTYNGQAFQIICTGLGEIGRSILKNYYFKENKLILKNSFATQKQPENTKFFIKEIKSIISKMKIPENVNFKDFSVGMQRRVLLAKAIISDPNILLLDEPTNHMDLDFIFWLENFLINFKKTIIFTTHDRDIIKALATNIVEIDKGKLISWNCNYDSYVKRKKDKTSVENQKNNRFDKKILNEEAWIRSGVKARRTRNKSRIKAFEKLIKDKNNRKNEIETIKIKNNRNNLSSKLIIEANNISFFYEKKKIFEKLSCKIMKGDRVGILGPNGCGKTTLVNCFLKHIKPKDGFVRHGIGIKIAYFDQCRAEINENKTVKENIFDGNDFFNIAGKWRHAAGYLKDFLFNSYQLNISAKSLSGGEKNRLLLAKLFAKSANFLVLDEPTNDLDIETLELLEKMLIEYNGTVLIVSHDRAFIRNIVTNVLFFEENAKIDVFIGTGDKFYNRLKKLKTKPIQKKKKKRNSSYKNKLNYMKKRELDAIPEKIELLEKHQKKIIHIVSKYDFYRKDPNYILNIKNELSEIQKKIETAYSRWEFLENLN